jgi:hypothetical protein
MRLDCASENSLFLGRTRVLAGHLSRLILTGAVLAGCFYGQAAAARPVADRSSFRTRHGCDSSGGTNSLNPRSSEISRSYWAAPATPLEAGHTGGCQPSLAVQLSSESAEQVESQLGSGTPAPVGLGGSLWAWNQQSPPPVTGQKGAAKNSASPGHIFWVFPAFHVDYAGHFTPLTPREKFNEWAQGAYDPLGLGAGAVEAATLEHSSKDGFCGYGPGWNGYARCLGSLELDANISSFIGDFALPVLWHQDPRYFRLGQGSFGRRAWYAVSRVFLTYNDSGHTVFYSSALAGTAIASGLSNLYYPQQDRGFSLTLSRVGIDLGNTALYNLAAEFWPDIKQRLYHTF